MPLGLPAAGIVRTPDNFEAPIKAFVDNLETAVQTANTTAAAAVTLAGQKFTVPVNSTVLLSAGTVTTVVKLTQAAYDALETKSATTLYLITA